MHFGGLRYVCTISALAGDFNHIYEQYIRMGGGAELQTLEVWLSTTKRSGDRGPKLRVCNPNHLGHGPIACEAVNPLFRCDLIPLKLLYYDVIICRVIQVNYVLNEIYGLNAFN